MNTLLGHVAIKLDSQLFVKDPLSSAVGQEIIRHSVNLISADGLEQFNFKKLAVALGSTESTVYRYFKNKHQLMMYLASWYWSMLEWRVAFATANVSSPAVALDNALRILSIAQSDLGKTDFLNESKLHDIVVTESFKAFVIKGLLKKERLGYFGSYMSLCDRVASIIQQISASYMFPKALAATLIETAHYQLLLRSRIPELTDLPKDEYSLHTLLHQLAFKALEEKK